MELSRLRRMVRARWWVVVAMALLGVFGAIAFTNFTNGRIEPRFTATASIQFIAQETTEAAGGGGGRDAEVAASTVDALVTQAETAATELHATLLDNPSINIRTQPAEGRLDFVATLPSAEAAEAVVEEMRADYLAVDPTNIDVAALIEGLIDEAQETQDRLAEFEPEPPAPPAVADVEDEAKREVLDGRIASLNAKVGPLQDALYELDPDDEEGAAAIEAQLDDISAQLTALKVELNELPPPAAEVDPADPVVAELTPAEQLEKAALEARMTQITTEYQALIGTEVAESERISLPELVVEDQTPAPRPLSLVAFVGLLLGAFLGVVVIIVVDRIQETVWVPGDMGKMPILAEVPQPAGSRVDLRPRRYQKVRQQGVQSIRSAVLGLFHAGGPVTIGFTGLGSTEQGVSELVLDVAHSLAGVGRSVLLIDGQLGGLPGHRDELAGGSTLADLSARSADSATLPGHVTAVLDGCVELAPNLSVLPGDPRTVDPVDVLASKSFRSLTEQATERFDVVIVVGPSALSPFAYVMAGLVSAYVVVTTVGRTRQLHIDQLVKQFAGSRSRLVGAVLLGVKPRRGWVPASDLSRSTAVAGAGTAVDDAELGLGTTEEAGLLDRLGQSLASLAGDGKDDK